MSLELEIIYRLCYFSKVSWSVLFSHSFVNIDITVFIGAALIFKQVYTFNFSILQKCLRIFFRVCGFICWYIAHKILVHLSAEDRDQSPCKDRKCGVLGSASPNFNSTELKAEVIIFLLSSTMKNDQQVVLVHNSEGLGQNKLNRYI